MNDLIRCLLCGRPLPQEAGLSLGPLFCEQHTPGELRQLGVIGFLDLGEISAPVEDLTRVVHGRPIREVGLVPAPYVLVLTLDGKDLLLLFPVFHRTAAAQYVPERAVQFPVAGHLAQPEAVEEPEFRASIAGLRAVIHQALPLLAIQHGLYQTGETNRDALTLRFVGELCLDVEGAGWSFFSDDIADRLALIWYREPIPPTAGHQLVQS